MFGRARARGSRDLHRASTPLELLVDLSFVVAVAQIAAELHHGIADGHAGESLPGYLMVFFAIWWAWMSFTWFASGFDVDDVPYRLLTLLQIGGVLVLAAGVPAAFEKGDFTAMVIGYVIMRIALVTQWLRVARDDARFRPVALRYALGIAVLQVGWVTWLWMPRSLAPIIFVVLASLEMLLPINAERAGPEPAWHPGHIAERYGLFTIIVLGETILASTVAVQASVTSTGLSWALVQIAVGGLVLIFGLWWCYFSRSAADWLRDAPHRALLWGYGHYAVFASAAAVGVGIQVVADVIEGQSEIGARAAALSIAIPVAVYLVVLGALQNRMVVARPVAMRYSVVAATILLIAAAAEVVGLPGVVLLIAAFVSGLIAMDVARPAAPILAP